MENKNEHFGFVLVSEAAAHEYEEKREELGADAFGTNAKEAAEKALHLWKSTLTEGK